MVSSAFLSQTYSTPAKALSDGVGRRLFYLSAQIKGPLLPVHLPVHLLKKAKYILPVKHCRPY